MKLLLDTHTLLWALAEPEILKPTVAGLLIDQSNTVFVFSASAWELATKVHLGKLAQAVEIERNFLKHMTDAGL